MPLFEWNESCSVNVPEFDKDHQYIFSLVNHLHEAMLCGRGRLLVAGMLEELKCHALTHFAAESAYMKASGFAGLALHESEHAAFAQQIEAFRSRYQAGTADLSVEMMNYMESWLIYHIQHSDALYAPANLLPRLSPAPPVAPQR
jgi:hemerythrin